MMCVYGVINLKCDNNDKFSWDQHSKLVKTVLLRKAVFFSAYPFPNVLISSPPPKKNQIYMHISHKSLYMKDMQEEEKKSI